jgi:hypothetical protein
MRTIHTKGLEAGWVAFFEWMRETRLGMGTGSLRKVEFPFVDRRLGPLAKHHCYGCSDARALLGTRNLSYLKKFSLPAYGSTGLTRWVFSCMRHEDCTRW